MVINILLSIYLVIGLMRARAIYLDMKELSDMVNSDENMEREDEEAAWAADSVQKLTGGKLIPLMTVFVALFWLPLLVRSFINDWREKR